MCESYDVNSVPHHFADLLRFLYRRPLLTIATASIFLHRFYMLESLKKYKEREVALACLFLAGKVEESLRKVETVVNYCLRLEDRRKGKEPDVHPSSEVCKYVFFCNCG